MLTAKHAVAVRCIGCGINGQLQRLLLSGTNGHNI